MASRADSQSATAISTLIQPPIVRTGLLPYTAAQASGSQKQPTSKDIPPVTLSNVPIVDDAVFKPYISQASSLYEAFRRAKENVDSGGTNLFARERDTHKTLGDLDVSLAGSKNTLSSQSSRQVSTTSVDLALPTKRSAGSTLKRSGNKVSPLSTIPSVYFDREFRLENPRIFDVVSEHSDVVRPFPFHLSEEKRADNSLATNEVSARKVLATNAILQEKLSWYMDTVEVHLISSISSASTSFFAALGSLRELHSETADSVKRIKSLREDLGRLNSDMALNGLSIVSKRRRRENLKKLESAMIQLKNISSGVEVIQGLIDQGNVEQAIDNTELLEQLIAGQDKSVGLATNLKDSGSDPTQLLDLRGSKALDGISTRLQKIRFQIGKAFEARFLEALVGDLRRHLESVPPRDTMLRWANAALRSRGDHVRAPSAFPAYMNLDNKLRSSMLLNLNGLDRSSHTMLATTAYRDAALREIKTAIRRILPSSNDDDNESMTSISTRGGRQMSQQEKSTILARNLRALDADGAEELLLKMYSAVGEALRRLGVQVKVLLDVTSGIGSPLPSATTNSPLKSPRFPSVEGFPDELSASLASANAKTQEEMHQVLDLSSLLGQAVDIAQGQVTKILKVRSDQTVQLPLPYFLRYFTLNRLFADECEAVSGRGGNALKSVVNGQIKEFVARLGEAEKQRLAQTMDSDQWNAKDFGEAENILLSRIIEGSTRDAEWWSRGSRVWEKVGDSADIQNGANELEVGGEAASKEKLRTATIDGQKFILPESALAVLKVVEKMENLIAGIPSMTQEVASNLLEYLKLFNSRSCQLILGAGATRSAGLKNITTKHLAIASQALSFVITLVPYIREFARRHSPSSNTLMADFDKVKRLFQEHQSGIHEKLVEIMSGRATTHVKEMKKIDWDDTSEKGQNVSLYMETLTKETLTLHRVLSKHLPESTISMIMDPVLSSYREQWGAAFQEVQVSTELGKNRLLRDAEHFRSKLCKIDGGEILGIDIIKLAREKNFTSLLQTASEHKSGPSSEGSADAS
ncbi:MAG: hypothetical protein M1829_006119 [Trizodia sp. TS-e1964]|nr:MAG: hypothetical protein M1829_006119 [Trizodia sp. TS-e1964]